MLPIVVGRAERKALKLKLISILKEGGGGLAAALPSDLLAERLELPTDTGWFICRLAQEIVLDREFPEQLGVDGDHIFLIVDEEDRAEAVRIYKRMATEHRRLVRLLQREFDG